MSKESVGSFYKRLSEDETMQKDYAEAIARGLLEAAAAFATARGFDLSPDDLSEKLQARSSELTEGELGAVAGGILGDLSRSGLDARGMGKKVRPGDVLAGILDLDKKI